MKKPPRVAQFVPPVTQPKAPARRIRDAQHPFRLANSFLRAYTPTDGVWLQAACCVSSIRGSSSALDIVCTSWFRHKTHPLLNCTNEIVEVYWGDRCQILF